MVTLFASNGSPTRKKMGNGGYSFPCGNQIEGENL